MLTSVQGYYNGSHIVLDENIKLDIGQQVIVTLLQSKNTRAPRNLDWSKYIGDGARGGPGDAQEYVKELRDGDRLSCTL